jgi:hypothetical protein
MLLLDLRAMEDLAKANVRCIYVGHVPNGPFRHNPDCRLFSQPSGWVDRKRIHGCEHLDWFLKRYLLEAGRQVKSVSWESKSGYKRGDPKFMLN